MVIVAVLEVYRSELDRFREYERTAARIMRAHDGDIERSVVVDDPARDRLTEIHVIRFASHMAFDAYRANDELRALQPLRDTLIASTSLFVGSDGPTY
jgi:hypothetical protein